MRTFVRLLSVILILACIAPCFAADAPLSLPKAPVPASAVTPPAKPETAVVPIPLTAHLRKPTDNWLRYYATCPADTSWLYFNVVYLSVQNDQKQAAIDGLTARVKLLEQQVAELQKQVKPQTVLDTPVNALGPQEKPAEKAVEPNTLAEGGGK